MTSQVGRDVGRTLLGPPGRPNKPGGPNKARPTLIALWLIVLTGAFVHAGQTAPTRSVRDGVYTAEQSKRGEQLYGKSCGSCHGAMLEGGEMAPALAGGAFTSNWTGLTMADLSDRIRVSMPQNSPGTLSRQQIADILAFMLNAGGYQAGASELPREPQILREIAFEAARP